MTDYTVVARADGTLWLHDPDCIEVTAARAFDLPLMTMGGVEMAPAEMLAKYEREKEAGDTTPQLHDCLREENMSTTDETILCPRCEQRRYMPYGRSRAPQGSGINEFVSPPALSRMDNATYICSDCGTDEAMRDMAGQPPIPPSDWPLRFGFGVGSHTPKPLDE